MTECSSGYFDWLASSFSFPDGRSLGTADIPTFPWRSDRGLGISGGRLSGEGTAVVGQGGALSFDGARLRFRVRFSTASQQVSVALNSARDGSGGVRLALYASGRWILSDGVRSSNRQHFPV